jgi:hypothetical protein
MVKAIASIGIFVSLILYMFNIISHTTYVYTVVPIYVVGIILYFMTRE